MDKASIAVLALLLSGTAAAYFTLSETPDPTLASGKRSVAAETATRDAGQRPAPRVESNSASLSSFARLGEAMPRSAAAMAAGSLQVSSKSHALWLSPGDFHPVGDPRQCALINDGSFLYRNSGPCTIYVARLPLPEGARVDEATLVGIDFDPNAQMRIGITSPAHITDFTDSYISVGQLVGNNGSGIERADAGVAALVSAAGPYVINYFQAYSPRSFSESFPLVAIEVPASQNLSVYGVGITWRTQYGPTPATAAYSDVPTQYAYFPEIEMLSRAGISNGCGAGRFCPDAPVTRGQMAVFLSRALGLYDATYDNTFPQQ